jgi:hypothetical protein
LAVDDDVDVTTTTRNFEFPLAFLRILTEDTKYVGVKQDCSLMGYDRVQSDS